MIRNTNLQTGVNRKFNYNNWIHHESRVETVLNGDFYGVKPLTVQLAPSLCCTHNCFFCSYGKTKKHKNYNPFMEWDLMKKVIDDLSSFGIGAITFTGGGEPTLYKHLIGAMEYCRGVNPDIDIGLFTNGSRLSEEMIGRVVDLDLIFVRVSLNAGTPETQEWVSGVDDFEAVLKNIRLLAEKKVEKKSQLDVSVGFVANVVNVYSLENLALRLAQIEGVSSIRIRPVVNYEESKNWDPEVQQKIEQGLSSKRFGPKYLEAFRTYMGGVQIPVWLKDEMNSEFEKAAKILEGSGINVFFAGSKFDDLTSAHQRPYSKCLGSSWILSIWPDGAVYPCIEWAGSDEFEIGNLNNQSLEEIWQSQRRMDVIELINSKVLHTRCAPTCVQHELNIILADIERRITAGEGEVVRKEIDEERKKGAPPKYKNFI